jgi:hypothetical protein
MAVIGLVAMAEDLELDEHYMPHQCITKARVWQTLYMMEIMVGGPKGK